MKYLLTAVLVCFGIVAQAQESPLAIGGISKLISEKSREAKIATMLDLYGGIGGAIYLPVWNLGKLHVIELHSGHIRVKGFADVEIISVECQ